MQRLSHQGSRCVGPLKHVASCSFGKDSLATILLALEHGEPLDEAVYCEVMFDKEISGEVPEHRDFIYTTAIPALERRGVKVTVLRSEKTYVDLFTGKITRGPKKGLLRSFPICLRTVCCSERLQAEADPAIPKIAAARHSSVYWDRQGRAGTAASIGREPGLLTGQVQLHRGRCKAALPAGRAAFACLHIYNPRGLLVLP